MRDPSFGFVKSVGSQQIIDQPHKFTSCKRKGAFIGINLLFRFLFGIILGKNRVVHPDTVRRFGEIVLEIAVTGMDKPGLGSFKIAGLVLSPSKAGKLSYLWVTFKLANITDFSQDARSEDRADAGNRIQCLRYSLKMILNGLL